MMYKNLMYRACAMQRIVVELSAGVHVFVSEVPGIGVIFATIH
jgi:hypothetical protein